MEVLDDVPSVERVGEKMYDPDELRKIEEELAHTYSNRFDGMQRSGHHHKASKLVKVIAPNGEVRYGLPRHTPMENWNDYDLVPTELVDLSS